ncbi:MAG: HAD family hydrolase [Lachnospiraceae bacterium]|nr:HAD family hydrolase [Lachnospiraceae bacterium]
MDGTILDTIEDLTDSLNYCMEKFSYPLHSVSEMKTFVGNGMRMMVERAAPKDTAPEIKDKIYECFYDYYNDHCRIKTKPYEGIPSLLSELRRKGVLTAVISNKVDSAVASLCNTVFKDCFDEYMGAMDNIPLKPERDMIDRVLEKLKVDIKDAVYVGDSQVDLQTGRNAGMDVIAVTWGFRSRDFLIKNGAKVLADDPLDLLELI